MTSYDVRIVGGGDPGPVAAAAITAAVERVLGARRSEQVAPVAAWALASRIESTGDMRVRSRSQLSGR